MRPEFGDDLRIDIGISQCGLIGLVNDKHLQFDDFHPLFYENSWGFCGDYTTGIQHDFSNKHGDLDAHTIRQSNITIGWKSF